jgi:hypothetical protein
MPLISSLAWCSLVSYSTGFRVVTLKDSNLKHSKGLVRWRGMVGGRRTEDALIDPLTPKGPVGGCF